MSAPLRLALFAAAVAVVLGLGFGAGRAVGPLDEPDDPPASHVEHDG